MLLEPQTELTVDYVPKFEPRQALVRDRRPKVEGSLRNAKAF